MAGRRCMEPADPTPAIGKGAVGYMEFKKLYRSRKHCLLCGVCGGIGEYAGVDPVLIRLIFLCLCLVGGGGLLLYLLAVLIIPKNPGE